MNEENGSEPQYVAKFPKTSKKPEKGWRSSLSFGVSTSKKKDRKPISPIGKRTKQRIKENGSETDMFREIWNERPHVCSVSWKTIPEPRPECFAHILSKWRYPALRYNKKNVALVLWIEEHHELDRRNAWNDLHLIREILS